MTFNPMTPPKCKYKPGDIVVHKTSGKIVQILYPFSVDGRIVDFFCQSMPYYSCRMPDTLNTIFIFYEVELEEYREEARA